MSIKENVDAIKSGLNSEEKLFENVVRFEYLYKKYKMVIWGVVGAVVLWIAASWIMNIQNEHRIETANSMFNKLIIEGEDAATLEMLKEQSRSLYELYTFQKAIQESDIQTLELLVNAKALGIADMARYTLATLSGDGKKLQAYAKEGVYFQDIARLQLASSYLKQSEFKKAHALLESISKESPFYMQAQALKHFGIVN